MSTPVQENFTLVRGGAMSTDAILWIHGYSMSAEIWREHWRLMPNHRHIGIELPAHGRTSTLHKGQTLAAWIDSLQVLTEREGVKHIVAVSFGGLVALALAARLGPALQTLVLNSPAIPDASTDPDAQGCNLELIRQVGSRGRGPWLSETWLAWPHAIFAGIRDRPARWETLRKIVESHDWREFEDGSINRMVVNERCTKLMRAVRASTLLITGEQDIPVFKRNVQILLRGLSHARHVRVERCGHLAMLEEPETAIELIWSHIG